MVYNDVTKNFDLPLTPSKKGNLALVIAWVDDVAPMVRSTDGKGYLHLPIDLIDITISYGGMQVFNMTRMADNLLSEFYDGAWHNAPTALRNENDVRFPEDTYSIDRNIKRLYEQYLNNLHHFGNHPDYAMSYEVFRARHPYIVIDMSNFDLAGSDQIANMIHVSLKHVNNRSRRMIAWLLNNAMTVYDPVNHVVLASGGL